MFDELPLPFLAPREPPCREDLAWRLFSARSFRESWGRVEGAMRLRARLKLLAISVTLDEENGRLDVRVTPRAFIKSITTTIGFSNPGIAR